MNMAKSKTHQTVTVIGGGIIGLFTAWNLVKEGFKVRVFERLTCGAGASNAAGGILMPLQAWQYPHTVSELVLHGNQFYPQFCEQLFVDTGIDSECRQVGLISLDTKNESGACEWSETHQLDYRCIGHTSLADYVPGCSATSNNAILFPSINQLTPARLIQALKMSLQQNGVQISENCSVKAITRKSDFRYHITTSNDVCESNYVVWATGAWPPALGLTPNSFNWPVTPVRGQMIRYEQTDLTLKHIVLNDEHYLIPRADRTILVGSTLERVGFNDDTTEHAFTELHSKSFNLFPSLKNASIIEHWAGLRPGSPDNIPIICEHPELEGLFFNTGHYRYGVAMAPASAEIITDLILKRESDWPTMEFLGPFCEWHHLKTSA